MEDLAQRLREGRRRKGTILDLLASGRDLSKGEVATQFGTF